MKLATGGYFHVFNRTNNHEVAFKVEENYEYFLRKYERYLSGLVDTLAFCLMPTHFHFLICVRTDNIRRLQDSIGLLQSSYTKAINKWMSRNGSLFQHHAKARNVGNDCYLEMVAAYIHQNPIRANLANNLSNWQFSSYRVYAGLDDRQFVATAHLLSLHGSKERFLEYNESLLRTNPSQWNTGVYVK